MPANLNELLVGFGFAQQADLATANVLAGIWRLGNINRTFADPKFVNENNKDWLGKGHEFITQQFKSHVEGGPHQIEKYLSSEFAAWLWGFGLGGCVKTGVGPWTYTCTPLDPATDGIEQPFFSYLEQIRPGGSSVVDRMLVGCAIRDFRIAISRGPGLANSKATVNFTHSGKLTEPSAITLPAETAENLLNAYSAAITIIGVDYVTLKTFESLEMGFDLNHRDESDYFPGSGQQNSYQIRGRLEYGDRAPFFQFSARLETGSSELTKLKALTTGTAVISLTADASNSMTVTWHQMAFETAVIGDANGIVTIQVTGSPQYHATNGIVTAVVVTTVDGICQ